MISRLIHTKDFSLLFVVMVSMSMPWAIQVNGFCLILFVAAALFYVRRLKQFQILRDEWMMIILCFVYLLLYVTSLTVTENMKEGVFHLDKKWSFALVPLSALIFSRRFPRARNVLFVAFAISIFCACLVCLVKAILNNYNDNLAHQLPVWYFNQWFFVYKLLAYNIGIHPAYLSWYIGVVLVFLALLLFRPMKGDHKLGIFVILLFLFVFEVLLTSRTVLFATIIVLTSILFVKIVASKNLKYFFVMIIIAGVTVFLTFSNDILKNRMRALSELGSENDGQWGTFNTRFKEWSASWELIQRSPFVGIGPGDFMDEMVKIYQRNGWTEIARERYNSHNQFLQTTAGMGVVGLGVLLAILFFSIKKAWRRKDQLYLGFLGISILFSLTESTLEVQKGIVFFILFNSFLFFSAETEPEKESSKATG